MIDELALVLERAPSPDSGDILDRISVRDYVREVEIGAFTSERGVTQRVRFNVVLEVSRHAAGVSDDVDQVISYDSIVAAIEHTLSQERLNLLEACAERIAERILTDPRAVRVVVRVEKLDRIPGALGVEIVRARLPEDLPKVTPPRADDDADAAPTPLVLALDPVAQGRIEDWLTGVRQAGRPVVLFAEPGAFATALQDAMGGRSLSEAARFDLRLLALDQAATALAGGVEGLTAAGSRTEIDHALQVAGVVVWAPAKMVRDAPAGERPGDAQPGELLNFLARRIGAEHVRATGEIPGAIRITSVDALPLP